MRRTQVNPRRSVENCTRCQNRNLDRIPGSVRRQPECGADGIRHREGVTRYRAWFTELGKLSRGCQGRRTRGQPLSARVPMPRTVAEPCVVCAGQRTDREGESPSGARMRGAVSKGGGNASPAEESRKVWRCLLGHEGESRTQPRRTCSHLLVSASEDRVSAAMRDPKGMRRSTGP